MKIRLVLTSSLAIALFNSGLIAATAVSNLGQPVSATTFAIGKSVPAFDFQQGISFTTGPGAYTLEGITLSFFSRNGAATGYTVALYSGLTAAGPTGLLAALSGNSTPSTGLELYTPVAPASLLGGTTYWVVESAVTTPPLSGFSRSGTTSLLEDAGALPGWSIGDARMVSNNGGASWFSASSTSGVPYLAVQAVASVPDSGATAAFLLVALSALAVSGRLVRRS